jgi:sRNA-binding protein
MEKNRKKLDEFLKKRFPNAVRLEKKIDIIQDIAESLQEDEEYDDLPTQEKMKERHRQNGGRKIRTSHGRKR